ETLRRAGKAKRARHRRSGGHSAHRASKTRVNALWHAPLPALRSLLHLDIGEVDDLLPLGGLFRDDLAEFVRRRDDRNATELGEALLDIRFGQDLVHFPI